MRNLLNLSRNRKWLVLLGLVLASVCLTAVLYGCRTWRYPVRGVDVSHYQGEIDWEMLGSQDIEFAYIKATEGSSHIDDSFLYNWQNAAETELAVGAYHFFSFDSPGDTQLLNFINTVGKSQMTLPPVVDIEFYGNKKENPPDVEETARQLQILLSGLEEYYQQEPIIYATQSSWDMYIKGRFDNYPLWIRNIITSPGFEGKDWLFWQYTDRGLLKGYQGQEKYIDLNVFNGNRQEWENFKN